ncbi:corticosteroid-binding protein [Burkholderiales bacterium GJ-E10]|nr:corticosteroid-binding protein [Burkholderiales bacterium GJ-E10]
MEKAMVLQLTENSMQWIQAAIADAEHVRIVAHEAPPVQDRGAIVPVWYLVGEMRRAGHHPHQSQIHGADGSPLVFDTRTAAEQHVAQLQSAVARRTDMVVG